MWEWLKSFLTRVGNLIRLIRDTAAPLADLRITFILLGLGAWIVLWLDQGRDVVRGLADGANVFFDGWWPAPDARPWIVRWLAFLCACIWTGLNAWYWANLLYKSKPRSPQPLWFRYMRRLLGVLPLVCAIAAIGLTSSSFPPDAWRWMLAFAIAAGLLLWFFAKRQEIALRLDAMLGGRINRSTHPDIAGGSLVAGDLWFIVTSCFLAAVMLALFCVPYLRTGLAWWLGPAAVSFGAIGCILPVTSIAIYRARPFGIPVVLLGLIAFAVFSLFNDNHAVRLLDEKLRADRPTMQAAYARWQARHPDPADPVVLVATAGGASRAAYWTGTVLRALDDNTDGAFSDHIFAISSVSGGSLGAIGYAAWLADHPPVADKSGAYARSLFVRKFFGQDYLGPAIAGLLFPDLVQRFLPFPVAPLDRARMLEESWERAWNTSMRDCSPTPCGTDDRFSQNYLAIWDGSLNDAAPALKAWVPIVLANGTHVGSGKRIITAPVQVKTDVFEDTYDFFDLVPGDVRASTAVHNSARFPIISPAGGLHGNGQIVDGGYFENGGLETAYDVARFIHGAEAARPIVIIEINNDDQASDGDRARHTGAAGGLPVTPAKDYGTANFLSEITSIVQALYQTGNGRGILGAKRISDFAASGWDAAKFYRFQLGQLPGGRRTTMSWTLSLGTRDAMDVMFVFDKSTVAKALEERGYADSTRQQLLEDLTAVIDSPGAKLNREELDAVVTFVEHHPATYQPPVGEALAPAR